MKRLAVKDGSGIYSRTRTTVAYSARGAIDQTFFVSFIFIEIGQETEAVLRSIFNASQTHIVESRIVILWLKMGTKTVGIKYNLIG